MNARQVRRDNTLEDLLRAGREAYALGDRHAAHEIWRMAAVANPYDERVWASLMEVLTRDDDREVCLENIIAINPLNPDARRQLRAIKRAQQTKEEASSNGVIAPLRKTQPLRKAEPPPLEPPPPRSASMLRAVFVGIEIGMVAVILGVAVSMVIYGGILTTLH